MLKKLAPLLLFNSIVGLCFIIANTYIWDRLNGIFTYNSWNPFQVTIAQISVDTHGAVMPTGLFTPVPNYPFILF